VSLAESPSALKGVDQGRAVFHPNSSSQHSLWTLPAVSSGLASAARDWVCCPKPVPLSEAVVFAAAGKFQPGWGEIEREMAVREVLCGASGAPTDQIETLPSCSDLWRRLSRRCESIETAALPGGRSARSAPTRVPRGRFCADQPSLPADRRPPSCPGPVPRPFYRFYDCCHVRLRAARAPRLVVAALGN